MNIDLNAPDVLELRRLISLEPTPENEAKLHVLFARNPQWADFTPDLANARVDPLANAMFDNLPGINSVTFVSEENGAVESRTFSREPRWDV